MKREIKRSSRFKKDFKRYSHDSAFLAEFTSVIGLLSSDAPLPDKYVDHELHGNWNACRDCHIRPDAVLIYQKTSDGLLLLLLRVGGHAQVFE